MTANNDPITADNAAAGLATASAASNLLGQGKKAWDESQGPNVLTDVASSIPERTKQMFSSDKIRGVSIYFGIGDTRPYSIEKNSPLLAARIKHNVSFFYLNYLVQSAIFYGLTILFSPGSLLEIGILACVWVFVMRATNDGVLNLGCFKVTRKVVSVGMTAISAVVLLYVLSNVFWWALTTSIFFMGVHALFRDSSKYMAENEVIAAVSQAAAESPVVMSEQPQV